LTRTDRGTHITKLIVAFRNFAKAPKNYLNLHINCSLVTCYAPRSQLLPAQIFKEFFNAFTAQNPAVHHRPVSWKPTNAKINKQIASALQYQHVCVCVCVCVCFHSHTETSFFISFLCLCQAMNVRSTPSVYTFQVTKTHNECA